MDYLRRKSDGRWVVRVVVPERLRHIVGQKQFERALGRDPRSAQRRAYPLIAEFQATIARAERQLELQGGDSPNRARRRFSLSEIAHTHYAEELAIDESVRNIPDLFTPLSFSRPPRAEGLRRVAAGIAPADETEALMGWAVDKFAQREGRETPLEPAERQSIARTLALVQLELVEREAERDRGDFTGQPSLPILQRPAEEPAPEPVKLQDLFDAHFRELEIQGAGAEAKRRWQPVFDDLRSFLRHNDARKITPEKLDEWKDSLMGRLKPKTIKDVYFAAVRAVFRSAVKARKLPSNPAAD